MPYYGLQNPYNSRVTGVDDFKKLEGECIKMSKLYINKEYIEDFSKEIIEDEMVFTLDCEEGYIIVGEDYKKEFNQKYDVELAELRKWLKTKYDYSEVRELIYEITEVEPLLSDYWEENTLTELYGQKIINKGLKLLFEKDDMDIINYVVNREKLNNLFKELLKPIMIKMVIEQHNEDIRNLKACL